MRSHPDISPSFSEQERIHTLLQAFDHPTSSTAQSSSHNTLRQHRIFCHFPVFKMSSAQTNTHTHLKTMSANSAGIISTPDAWYCVSERIPDLIPLIVCATYHDVLFGLAKLRLWAPQSSPRCWLCQLRVHTSSQTQAASTLLCIFETIHLPNCSYNSSCDISDIISDSRGERAWLQHLQPPPTYNYLSTQRSRSAHHQSSNLRLRLRFTRSRVSHFELIVALHRFLFHKQIDDEKI